MNKPVKCPCRDCLTIAICNNRRLDEILKICLAFSDYVKFQRRDDIIVECYTISNYDHKRLIKAEKILNSNTWELEKK